MELPAEVLIHNAVLSMKGSPGTLLQVSAHGYYEANVKFGEGTHRVMLPIAETSLIAAVPEEAAGPAVAEIER